MPQKLLQVIPDSLVFTPDSGTAVTVTDFAEPVTFTYSVTYGDIASQSSEYSIGKLLTGKAASLRTTINNVDLAQISGLSAEPAASYVSASDKLSATAGDFTVKYGDVVFTGTDTGSGKTVKITLNRTVAMVSGDMTFGKDSEVRTGIQFDAVRPTAAEPAWTIEVVTTP